jgi:hypothetical protein
LELKAGANTGRSSIQLNNTVRMAARLRRIQT